MKKSIFEKIGGTYHHQGDYLLPNLTPPESIPVGIWGQRRRHYLKTHREPIYTALFLAGELDSHLSEIDVQAETTFFSWSDSWQGLKALQNSLKLKIR